MHRSIEHPALKTLKQRFPQTKLLVGEFRDMITVIVPRENLLEICTFLRDDPQLRYDMLAEINSVDYLNYAAPASLCRQLRPHFHLQQQPALAEGFFRSDHGHRPRHRAAR